MTWAQRAVELNRQLFLMVLPFLSSEVGPWGAKTGQLYPSDPTGRRDTPQP